VSVCLRQEENAVNATTSIIKNVCFILLFLMVKYGFK